MRLAIVAGLLRKGPAPDPSSRCSRSLPQDHLRVSSAAMRLGRAICVSLDEGVCQVVADALLAAGLTVEHASELPADATGAVAVIVDRATRLRCSDALRTLTVP